MGTLKEVTIYTDGGCINNPGSGGYGVVLRHQHREKHISGGFRLTTNNRMELMAVIVGLKTLKMPCSVTVYSDSKYIVDAMTKGWVNRWKANNWWRNKEEKTLNIDLWEKLLLFSQRHQVRYIWVKGHAGHRENEICDNLAKEAAKQTILSIDEGYESSLSHQEPTEQIIAGILRPGIQIQFKNTTYSWSGTMWYDVKTFLEPPKVIINKLNALLLPKLEQEDEQISELHEFLQRAKEAKAAEQHHRAIKLVRKALSLQPFHVGALAILSSVLRATGQAQQALDETDAFATENYPPLLQSRAAALCDLERWEEAKQVIGRVLAIGNNPDAFSIVHRIKAARPDLYM